MSVATMTSKGQITVPKNVRDAMGLRPGTKVEFVRGAEDSATWQMRAVTSRSLADLGGLLKYDGPVRTIDEMNDAIAGGFAEVTSGVAE